MLEPNPIPELRKRTSGFELLISDQTGHLQPPVRGRWQPDGTFVAHGPDTLDGRDIIARFIWHSINQTSQFGAGFSIDQRRTWETNWIMT